MTTRIVKEAGELLVVSFLFGMIIGSVLFYVVNESYEESLKRQVVCDDYHYDYVEVYEPDTNFTCPSNYECEKLEPKLIGYKCFLEIEEPIFSNSTDKLLYVDRYTKEFYVYNTTLLDKLERKNW